MDGEDDLICNFLITKSAWGVEEQTLFHRHEWRLTFTALWLFAGWVKAGNG
jgi:hypothetical protein